MLLADLKGRDLAILGAGREGLAAWRWLNEHCPGLRLTLYTEYAPDKETRHLMSGFEGAVVVGPFKADLLARHEVLVRSPGVSPYRAELEHARRAGVRFTSASSLWFAAYPEQKTICITGTKGKSTTAALTAHLLRSAGKRVCLAGNIGTPLLECDPQGVDWWVIELSSYQLADLEAEPTLCAILNLSDEHLDWHAGSAGYRADKLKIAKLNAQAPLVANARDEELLPALASRGNITWFNRPDGYHCRDNVLWRGESRLHGLPRQSIPGPHNLANLAAALTLAELAGVSVADAPQLATWLSTFEGLPHRLKTVGIRDGVRYINDSLSTTPLATLAALRAYPDQRLILLVGGLDRGLDWSPWIGQMAQFDIRKVYCLPDNGPLICRAMQEAGLDAESVQDLDSAMRAVTGFAAAGATVLLSPGAPSFPRFRDFAERGERFTELAGFESGHLPESPDRAAMMERDEETNAGSK
jgi:UDP-N-acetylmuramoylalanine--D-glutamate ligase